MKVFLRKSSKIKRTEERKRKKKKAPLGSNKGLLVGIKASRTELWKRALEPLVRFPPRNT